MKCYYEILGVDKSASSDIIKKAYYKLSLKWHPDKNPDNIVEATENFQEIQRASKVLLDFQERAWYDKNRERFLSMKFNSEVELYDLINNIIYVGFNDDENGFFNVHEQIFLILIDREHDSCRIRGESLEIIPNFGNSKSNYKEVVGPFYSYWESFNTKMSFHWKNKHEINLSYPRDVRRAMEKENTEERTSARKQYNKTIQSLIINLKSKDPRIKLWKEQLDEKAKDNEKKAAQMAQRAWERSRQNANLQNSIPSYGDISVGELEEKLKSLEIEHGKIEFDKDSDSEDLYCVACNKYFRSSATFNNHSKSKNHNKNLAALRKHMVNEDNDFFAEILNETSNKKEEPSTKSIYSETIDYQSEILPHNKMELGTSLSLSQELVTNFKNETILVNEDQNSNRLELEIDSTENVEKTKEDGTDLIMTKSLDKKRRRKPKSEKNDCDNQTKLSNIQEDTLICEKCGVDFISRNKLFQHIKSTGHGTIKADSKTKLNIKTNKKLNK